MLYHFSEEPGIREFRPRPSRLGRSLVWAIDEEHAAHYMLPRDCPRVIVTRSERNKPEEEHLFFVHSTARKLIALENRWMETIRCTRLYRYSFEPAPFRLEDETAGYYVSEEAVVPVDVQPVGDLLNALLEKETEVRFMPNLYPLRNAVIATSLDFSIIRFRNAIPLEGNSLEPSSN